MFEYQVIEDQQTHFIFDKQMIEDEIGEVSHSLVVVSNFINPGNLYMKDVNVDELNQYMIKNGIPEGIGFQMVTDRDAWLFDTAEKEMNDHLFLIVIISLSLLSLSIHLLSIFQQGQKKKLALKLSHGYPVLKTYEALLWMLALFYGVLSVYLYWQEQDWFILVIVTSWMLIELLLMCGNERWIQFQAKWVQWFQE